MRKQQNREVRSDARRLVFVSPGPLDTRTGGYKYDRRMIAGLRAEGWSVDVRELRGSFPEPSSAVLNEAARVLASIPDGALVLIDGLAFGAMPAQVEREAPRLRMVALVHMPLASEIGLDPGRAARFAAAERRALTAAAHVIVTGKRTIAAASSLGVPVTRITVVEPGTDRASVARGSLEGPLHLLCVATLNPGKGHDILLRALAAAPRGWRLTCAGSLDRHPPTVQKLRAMLELEHLEADVLLAGELDAARLAACYDEADLFVLATRSETYGMAVADALAHGLPIVSTATGAIPDLVGDEAGIIVPPGDTKAFAAALVRVLADTHLRGQLAEGARRMRDRLPAWSDAVDRMSETLTALAMNG